MASEIKTASVKIWGQQVGAVSWNEQEKLGYFEFDPKFIKTDYDLAPIHMPIKESHGQIYSFRNLSKETFYGLPGLLADSLPDKFGHALINAWLAQEGRTQADFSPVERLCYVGKRGMGALEFEPPTRALKASSKELQIEELVDIANKVLNDRENFLAEFGESESKKEKALSDILQIGTSAGGMRPKAVIAFNKQTKEIRSGQAQAQEGFEHWLLKFDGVSDDALGDPKGYGRIEYTYYELAKKLNIEISDCLLLEENGRAHFMTQRFDREGPHKHHIQTLCAIDHLDYNIPSAHSYEQAFRVVRKLKMPQSAVKQLFRRMVFNIVGRNQDDHTKNISFILKKEKAWALAPAYDLTYAYRKDSPWVSKHQMSMNAKRDDFALADFEATGQQWGVDDWLQIVEEAIDIFADFKRTAQKNGVGAKEIQQIEAHLRLKFE